MAGVFGLSDFRIEQLEGNIDESANYGYFAGGIIPNTTNIVDRLDNKTDVVSRPSATLPRDVGYTPTVFNKNFGYIAGGYRGGLPAPDTFTSYIQRIDFSNEVVDELTPVLTQGRYGIGQCSTDYYGYFVGGTAVHTGPPQKRVCTIDRIDFSTETVDVPPVNSQSTQARGSGNTSGGGIFDSNYGYFGGGSSSPPSNTNYCTMDRLEFATETVALPPTGNQLTQARASIGETKVENYGYFAGGHGPPTGIPPGGTGGHVTRLEFLNETMSVISPNLPLQRGYAAGTYDLNYGYWIGGLAPPVGGPGSTCTIDRIDFSTDTLSSTPQIGLTANRYAAGGISGGKLINAKGFKKNKTDKVGNPISKSYGYFGGGESSPGSTYYATIDRIDFSSETISPLGNNLPQGRSGLAGASSPNYGYFGGGFYSPPLTYSAVIDRIDFSNGTTDVAANNLTQARPSLAGVSSPNYGYFGGGWAPPLTDLIDRIDFSNETTSAAANNLTESRYYLGATSNSNYGYFGGGGSPPTDLIDRIDFSTETTSAPGNDLSESRTQLGAVSSSNYGYFCGGYDPPYSGLIDRIDFSNETMSLPGNDLTEARYGMGVVSNSNYGYFGAGNGPGAVVTVDKIDFSNDTISPSTNNLPTAKDKLAAVSG